MHNRTGYELEIVRQRQTEIRNQIARHHEASQCLHSNETKATTTHLTFRHKLSQALVSLGQRLISKTEAPQL